MSSTTSAVVDDQSGDPLIELGDKLALTYAASLHTPVHWKTAVFVYTHLSSPTMREHYIRGLLAQYAKSFSIQEGDETYKYLVEELNIPSEWLHAAAALQAKTDGDNLRQTMHLIKAGELEEAHEVLCRSVGPESIISRDYDALRELLGEFVPTPEGSPIDETASMSSRSRARHPREPVPGWSHGGQIYFDYIHLLDLTSQQSSYRVDEELNAEINALLSKLQHALEAVARDRMDGCGLEERVAIKEIAGVVAGLVAKNKVRLRFEEFGEARRANVTQHNERSRVLKLPLAEDLWLRHSTELSLNYYRAVMATGK
jgi:nuclear pore complex protein Nup98-Nup96